MPSLPRLRGRGRILVLVLSAAAPAVLPAPSAAAGNLIANPSFETSTAGWTGWNAGLRRTVHAAAPDGRHVVTVSRRRGAAFAVDDARDSVGATIGGMRYVARARVAAASASSAGKRLTLRVRERAPGGAVVRDWSAPVVLATSFRTVAVALDPRGGSSLDVRLSQASARPGDAFHADGIVLEADGAPAPSPAPPPAPVPIPPPAPAPSPAPAPAPPPAPLPPPPAGAAPTALHAESFPYDPSTLFNREIPPGTPDDPRSDGVVAELVANVHARKVAATVSGETPPVYVASPGDALYAVTAGGRQVRFRVPAGAVPGSGADYPLVILDPDHPDLGRHVEMRIWQAGVDAAARRLSGSGVGLFHYNNDGVRLNPDGSASASVPFQGVGTGSGLSYLAGMIRPEEVASGEIRHALRFSYSCTDSSSRFRAPAVRTDQPHPQCAGDTTVTPDGRRMDMGMRLRLDPAVDCDSRTAPVPPGRLESARETRFLRMVCRALQRYGMIMLDGTGPDGVMLYLENELTAPWSSTIGDKVWDGYGWIVRDSTTPSDGLARTAASGIPWDRLRVVAPFD